MKFFMIVSFILSFGISGCQASDKKEVDNFIKNDFKNYIADNRKLILEANKNIALEPDLKEVIFKNTYIKVKTAQILLNDEYPNWLIGLDKNNFDYTDLNTLCWMTVYMNNYILNMNDANRKNITSETIQSVNIIYNEKNNIIKLRDSKNDSLKYRLKICK